MLAKKRQRSATQPITLVEVFAAKSNRSKEEKSHDDLDLIDRPFRGRLLSVPTTHIEVWEVKTGSSPQKYVRPKSPVAVSTKTSPNKTTTKSRGVKKPVSAKVDTGRTAMTRTATARRSVRATKTKTDSTNSKTNNLTSVNKGSHSSLVDARHVEGMRPMQRSASVRVSGSALGSSSSSVKAAAERASALVDAKKKAKVGNAIRARATAKVDSRRTPTDQVCVPALASSQSLPYPTISYNVTCSHLQLRLLPFLPFTRSDRVVTALQISGRRPLRVSTDNSSSAAESCPLSPASTDTSSSINRPHAASDPHRPRRSSGKSLGMD